MADKNMAMIMVDAGGPGKLPTYAGITYFYSTEDYKKVIKPLWESGKLGRKGDVLSPAQVKAIVGKPFSCRYGIAYEKKYDLKTSRPKAVSGQLKVTVTKAPAPTAAKSKGKMVVSKRARAQMQERTAKPRRSSTQRRVKVSATPTTRPSTWPGHRRGPGILTRRGRLIRQRRGSIA